jgi:hypothetical protein
MEMPAAFDDYLRRGFDSKETPMNADSGTNWMTLSSLQIINLGDSSPAKTKWNFTIGALSGSTVSAIGYLLYHWVY